MVEDCGCKNCGCGKMSADQMWEMIDDQNLPFTEEIIDESTSIRTFNADEIKEHQLKWHWDEQDRVIEVLHETDWKIQFDNKIPVVLDPTVTHHIKAGLYHRLIKGTGTLSLKINKLI